MWPCRQTAANKVHIDLSVTRGNAFTKRGKPFLGFPYSSAGKESACHEEDLSLIPGLGRSPGEGKGCPLHYSGLDNSMDCIVHGITKSWT